MLADPRSNRRAFLGRLGGIAGAGALAAASARAAAAATERLHAAIAGAAARPAVEVARDEAFWLPVQQAWDVDRSLLNFNNGSCSPAPRVALEALFRDWRFANELMYHHLMTILDPRREAVRTQLAGIFGADRETIALVRNASEALETITFGIELARGDEILTTTHDYPRMITAWRQREARDGVVLKQVVLPVPLGDPADLVAAFAAAITPRTRVLHLSHIHFTTGQIGPVKALCDLARSRGIRSIVDGAHAFAHLDAKIGDIGADYYGTSLHKWLAAPVGNGMLYVRKELIPSLWPLFAHPDPKSPDIRKFEEPGTNPVPILLAVSEAVALHQLIGAERKQERLRYLRDAWATPLAAEPRCRILPSLDPVHSCGIACVAIDGIEPVKLAKHLLEKELIYTAPIGLPDVNALRVTPNVYTTLAEVDRFVEAVRKVARNGLPG
ncbi:MAG: aminotransferase class V-fold PLP-dependent enzyme [Planctomycetes bacterium]|nr:aminotransferase class V-fold PLP-dependent enzyme [Planctomycetota bacterium]